MKNIAVVYKSKYGSTKKYAEWIAQELDADLFNVSNITPQIASRYETIIYGGGLYAGGIIGISFITDNFEKLKGKNLIIFTVGLGDPSDASAFESIINKNLNQDIQKKAHIFHLRGGINYKKLNLIHKCMMAMLKKMVTSKKDEPLTDENKQFLETYGSKVDFTDKNTITPLVSLAKVLQEG